jgi:hypothetical protein
MYGKALALQLYDGSASKEIWKCASFINLRLCIMESSQAENELMAETPEAGSPTRQLCPANKGPKSRTSKHTGWVFTFP